jgi:hypothetical protein
MSLPLRFLRDSDEQNFDPLTRQRADIVFEQDTGKPAYNHRARKRYQTKSSRMDASSYVIDWEDGVSSTYPISWVNQVTKSWQKPLLSRELWTGLNESDLRNSMSLSMSFDHLVHQEGMSMALRALYSYGIILVKDTPINDSGAGIAAMGAALSGSSKKTLTSGSLLERYRNGGTDIVIPNGTDGPLRTLYGTVWFTNSEIQEEGTSTADSSYGQGSLPLHTDMAYVFSPPGLQIFTMIQPAEIGGESVYADGFAAAEQLRVEDPRSFEILTNTVRRYRCIDEQAGWHLEASGPIIESRQGIVFAIRHNELDRLPDLPPCSVNGLINYDQFYDELANAHATWDSILKRDSTRLVIKLRPGETVIIANQVSRFASPSVRS